MLNEEIKRRMLPPYKSREEMIDILCEEEYGRVPQIPFQMTFDETEDFIPNFCAGKAISKKVVAVLQLNGTEFSFPFYVSIPKSRKKCPFFVCINFRDLVPDRYIPTEEIIDEGFAVLSFCYEDVTKDNADFSDGLAKVFYKDGLREKNSPGKIALWAWAAQRVMDYAETQPVLDMNCSIVCGHSRLGKTALLAAATDERFQCVFSNNSGCSGAALTRGKQGENLEIICKAFPYWFCENYLKYVGNEYEMPFDQHYLTACVAPRYVYIASAADDLWSDPVSEMLTCVAVSEVYEKNDRKGFVCEDRYPKPGDVYHEGTVGYHLRDGLHYLSREDWIKAIAFVKKHFSVD